MFSNTYDPYGITYQEPRTVDWVDSSDCLLHGKHKNKKISDVPKGYLKWLLANVDNISDSCYMIIQKEIG